METGLVSCVFLLFIYLLLFKDIFLSFLNITYCTKKQIIISNDLLKDPIELQNRKEYNI